MVGFGQGGPVPADKLVTLNLVQLITSLYMGDTESASMFLQLLKQDYAKSMTSALNPTLKRLLKDILQSIDMYKPSDVSSSPSSTPNVQPSVDQTPASPAHEPVHDEPASQPQTSDSQSTWMSAWKSSSNNETDEGPTGFSSELTKAVGEVRERKTKTVKKSLRGSLDDLDNS